MHQVTAVVLWQIVQRNCLELKKDLSRGEAALFKQSYREGSALHADCQ